MICFHAARYQCSSVLTPWWWHQVAGRVTVYIHVDKCILRWSLAATSCVWRWYAFIFHWTADWIQLIPVDDKGGWTSVRLTSVRLMVDKTGNRQCQRFLWHSVSHLELLPQLLLLFISAGCSKWYVTESNYTSFIQPSWQSQVNLRLLRAKVHHSRFTVCTIEIP